MTFVTLALEVVEAVALPAPPIDLVMPAAPTVLAAALAPTAMIFETLALEDVNAVAVPANAMFFVTAAAPTVCAVAATPMAFSGLFRLASPDVAAVAFVAALATLMTLDVALVVAVADARMPKDLVSPATPTVTPPTEAAPDCLLVLPSAPDADADTDAALAI
jgi:hypothetical protein